MRARSACVLVALLLSLSWTPLFAKGGHGGGGHAGGHASGGQGSGGHASGGHSTGRSSTGRATARSGASAVVPATTTSSGHTRTGQPISGSAVPRANVPPMTSTGSGVVIGPAGIWPYYGGLVGGAFYYDPFYYDPFYWNPYSTPFSPGYGPGFSAPGFGDESNDAASVAEPFATDGPSGGLRLKVEPKNADVFVDGHHAGIVDDFDGMFQHLTLRPGSHHVNVRAPGYEPLGIDIVVQPHHTTVYHGVLTRSQP